MQSNDIKTELGTNFIEYAAAVNTDRAIPDATSGLKPVATRIIYGAYATGRVSSKKYVKNARIVGDVMGTYHPHGDSSIYGALVRLSQPWVMRYPLIDFHGNQGNIDGDGPAAMRYTEGRLHKLAEDGLLKGIKKNNVDFIPNYDDTTTEPVTLPAIFPNLLCNPNTGIGVAIACNWLPHNLNEVATAIYEYMDGKEPSIPAPDFPTGGLIINANELPNIIKNGRGSVKVRGQYKIEKNNIIFYEIPYGTNTESLIAEVGKACDEGSIEGVVDIRNESNKGGLRIVIECAKTSSPEAIVNRIFSKTNFQTSISYNQVALVNKTPTELTLKDCIKIYVKHNIECLVKEINYDLTKAKARLHIIEGLLICLEDIDNVIQLIKKSENSAAAKIALINKYKISDEQAKAVLAMRLSSLAHMEKIELENEKKELIDSIEEMESILASEEKQEKIIRERLEDIVRKYGDKRRTELTNIEIKPEEKEIAEVIPEDVVVILTQTGNIKRVPATSFKVQRRGGKGTKTPDNAIIDTISTNTIDTLMAFTDKGKMYRLIVDNIPSTTNAGKGVPINSLIKCELNEKVIAITSLHRKTDAEYVVFLTKNGMLKKTKLEEYMHGRKSTGIAAIKLKEGDSIANVTFLKDEDIVIITKNGFAIKFKTDDITPTGRATMGVKAIKLEENDTIISGLPIHKKTDEVAIIIDKGNGKKVPLNEFPLQGRGGKGVTVYKTSPSAGYVVGAEMISDEDNILLIGRPTSICVSAKDIPSISRIASGNILIKGTVTSVVKL